jgi:uncharacterized protein YnzC (UPF0291/DUF896 family)
VEIEKMKDKETSLHKKIEEI